MLLGRLLRDVRKDGGPAPDITAESVLLIRAARALTLPKLSRQDSAIFAALLADTFPGVHAPDVSDEQLEAAIVEGGRKLGLEPTPAQVGGGPASVNRSSWKPSKPTCCV